MGTDGQSRSAGRGVRLSELAPLVDQYRAGLEAEMTLLHRLEALAAQQRVATEAGDYGRMTRLGDERDAVMSSLTGSSRSGSRWPRPATSSPRSSNFRK